MKLTQYAFPANQFTAEENKKVQIYLHHTAGNPDPINTFKFWESNPEKIATCVIVGGKPVAGSAWEDGEVIQGFSSRYWAYHLGLKESTFTKFGIPYKSLDRISIGVEICNWGQLTLKKDGKYYNYVNRVVSPDEVVALDKDFRGFKYYHAYTDAQIAAVKDLLITWRDKYEIPIDYHEDIFDVNTRALKGDPGVFTHCSVRYDKNDLSPQPKMIAMLKTLI